MRRPLLPLLAAVMAVAPMGAAHGAEVSKSMPPFLIGTWRIGKLLPFAPSPDVVPLPELDAMLAGERTVHITPSSIAFIPRFNPRPGGGNVTAVADEKRLSDLATLDPSAVAGTP